VTLSRILFTLGLILSLLLHGLLLVLPHDADAANDTVTAVIPVLVTDFDHAAAPTPEALSKAIADEPVETPAPDPTATSGATAEPPPTTPVSPEPDSPTPAPAAPPMPLTETTRALRTDVADRGDFAGDPDGRRDPVLRIDWGRPADARAVREAAEMQLVVLDTSGPAPIITGAVQPEEDSWRRRAYLPAAGTLRFSNHLRVVNDVPAFAEIRRTVRVGANERLAVLIPVDVERRIQGAQIEAASRHGLALGDVRSMAGHFVVTDGGLRFEIIHLER